MTEPETRSATRLDWLLIAALFALVLPLRLWLLHNTEATARDSIGYIRYALQFDKQPWQQVCAGNHQHPGYPMLVWLMAQPVNAINGGPTPEGMQLSAQLVSFIASLLLLLPMYFLGRQFFDRSVSFGAALLYQYLPISAQHLSDGISEPTYLLLLTSALLQAVHAVRERSIGRSALCGLFAGAAYVVRPEGLLTVIAFALVMTALQIRSEWRVSWKRFSACATATMLAVMLSGSVYVMATGHISNKPAVQQVIKNLWRALKGESFFEEVRVVTASSHLFARSFTYDDSKIILVQRGVGALAAEISQGVHYVGVIPALFGFWWAVGSLHRQAGFWVLATYALLHAMILISLGMSVYYVSDRHVMILVIGACYFAVHGMRELALRLLPSPRMAAIGFAILVLALIAFSLPKSTQRLHHNRTGNRAAGLWLKEQLRDGDIIEDDHGWSHFFSGLILDEGKNPAVPRGVQPRCFVVVTKSNDAAINEKRERIAADAPAAYWWPVHADVEKARVVVYRMPRDPQRNPWRIAD